MHFLNALGGVVCLPGVIPWVLFTVFGLAFTWGISGLAVRHA